MSKLALPCVKCGKPLENVFEEADNQPSGGTEFSTYGHYGSTIHDSIPVDGGSMQLVVNICDTCILRALDEGVIQGRSKTIALSRHPVSEESRAWVLAQNYKHYGAAYGDDEVVDFDALMRKAGWDMDNYPDDQRPGWKEDS